MLEAKYFKDYKHNYMILQCGQEAAARSYQYKILTSDKIREILRCSVRHINGVTYYYYDISSRTTLKNLYQSTKMSYEQVRDLLRQIHGICDKLAGFFMEEAGLVLLPEHIYYDFSTQKYIGLYYPDYQVTGREACEPLMNFLLEHIDGEDRQLAEKMYRICDMVGESHFLIEDALQILEERAQTGDDVQLERPEKSAEKGDWSRTDTWPESRVKDEAESCGVTEAAALETRPQEERAGEKRSLFYPVFAVLSALGTGGAAAVYNMYELVQEEEIALYGIMAVLCFCFLASLWGMIRGNRKKQTSADQVREAGEQAFEKAFAGMVDGTAYGAPNERPRERSNETHGKGAERTAGSMPGADNILLGGVINRDMSLDMLYEPVMRDSTSYGYGSKSGNSGCARDVCSGAGASTQEQEMDYCGNTIFFDESRAAEYKLYAVDRRNKRHIELKQFPCTIGKMAGCVDHVLPDQSVSRIHARFDRQGDKVFLTDMNSMNGTYKNGLRMQPQETVEIEPGDEIRFGSLNYCYR